jgi:OOP family OmpA-OmpF porin
VNPRILFTLVTATALILGAGPSRAEKPTLFHAGELTEEGFANALQPAPGVRARTIGVKPTTQAAAPKPASASVLITFHTNSAQLTPEAQAALDVVANAMKDRLAPYDFVIEGHADPRGTASHNLTLSQRRAESVMNYLVHRHGVDASRLRPVGKGDRELYNEERPTAPENRRVTFINSSGGG